MDQLIELLQQIQDLAGVAVDALKDAGGEGGDKKPEGGGDRPEGGPPKEGGEKPPAEGAPAEGAAPKDEDKPPFAK